MGAITISDLHLLTPELFLAGVAVFMLMLTVFKCPKVNNEMLSLATMGLAFTAVLLLPLLSVGPRVAFNDMFASDNFIVFAKLLILGAGVLVLLLAANWLKETEAPSEFLVLMLIAILGMLLMVSANDMLALYMALEMSSLALYVLASFTRDHSKSSEAGLKYFMLGALASGMLLFGTSLVYGFAGTIGFIPLAKLFVGGGAVSLGVVVGLVLIMVGFCFKLSAVPFHMWTPDVYEGAPTPVAAFFATAPKIAALALFTRLLLEPFGALFTHWQQIIEFAAVASMFVGAFAAIMQKNIKRLLAYSSIGHVGFMLMALAAGNAAGVQAMLVYLALYIFMSALAFGCVLFMRRSGVYVEDISDLAGLSQTRPGFAILLSIALFSMTGIPPLAGFFGKMYVIIATLQAGLVWLAVAGVIAGVIGGYYYLKVVKVMYFDPPAEALDARIPCTLRLVLFVSTAVTLLFFLHPTPLVEQAKLAAQELMH